MQKSLKIKKNIFVIFDIAQILVQIHHFLDGENIKNFSETLDDIEIDIKSLIILIE
jgi:hypothetical protein